jgi:hypothetical protein
MWTIAGGIVLAVIALWVLRLICVVLGEVGSSFSFSPSPKLPPADKPRSPNGPLKYCTRYECQQAYHDGDGYQGYCGAYCYAKDHGGAGSL